METSKQERFYSFISYLELGGLPALPFSTGPVKYWPRMIEQTCFETSF